MKKWGLMHTGRDHGRRHGLHVFAHDFSRMLIVTALIISLLAVPALLLSCGGGATVTMKELKFEPDSITIKKGEKVTWNNEDRRDRQIMSGHPPVMTDEFMSPVLKTGESWSFTFDKPGEYAYHDMKIPGLLGSIIVEE